MLWKCNHRGTFCCKLRLHKCPWSRVMTNLRRRPKSAIFCDFAKGKCSKSRPTIRDSKTPWRKSHHRLNSMHLKCNHRGTFCCKLRLHKCPWSRVMTNLPRRPKSAIGRGDQGKISEILPRGDQGKMLKKVARLNGLQKHPGANRIIA